MKFTHLAALAMLSLLAMSNSCKKENDDLPCPVATITTMQMAGFKPCITEPVAAIGQSHQYVINSVAEYKELFTCGSLPEVDFTKYTLLAGKTKTANCSHLLAQQVVQNCTSYTYTVKLTPGVCAAVTDVVYYTLVPKIASGTQVSFEVLLLQEAGS